MSLPVRLAQFLPQIEPRALPGWLWWADSDLRLLRPPGGVQAWCGAPMQALAGALAADPLLDTDLQAMRRRFAEAVRVRAPLRGICIETPEKGKGAPAFELAADPLLDRQGKFSGYVGWAHDCSPRRKREHAILAEVRDFTFAFEAAEDGLWEWIERERMIYYSSRVSEILGGPRVARAQHEKDLHAQIHPEDWPRYIATVMRLKKDVDSYQIEYRLRGLKGNWVWVNERGKVVRNSKGHVLRLCGATSDITARKRAEEEKLEMERLLRHSQKLESLGTLAGGVAHEINSPVQYVSDNIQFLEEGFRELTALLRLFSEAAEEAVQGPPSRERLDAIASAAAAADLPFLLQEMPRAAEEAKEGIERVTEIVRAIKEFSHPGGREKVPADLNRAIATTLTVTRNQWKAVAEVETAFDDALPPVPCHLGEFNQVILNLIVNAADALAESGRGGSGRIRVATRHDGDWAEVRVSDNGPGVPPEIAGRIFDPFFTTKQVGKGTGQGLAISHGIIAKKHAGSLTVEDTPGGGATFVVRLPLQDPACAPA